MFMSLVLFLFLFVIDVVIVQEYLLIPELLACRYLRGNSLVTWIKTNKQTKLQ